MQHSKRRFYRTPLWRRIVCYSVAGILLFRLGGLLFRSPAKGLVAPAPGQYAVRQVNDAQVLSLASIGGEGDVAVFDVRVIGIGPLTADEPWRKVAREACADICGDRLVRIRLDKRRIDSDGVWLAHVYVDDELLSYLLVKRGMAAVSGHPSDSPSVMRRLEKALVYAQQNRIGFWRPLADPSRFVAEEH